LSVGAHIAGMTGAAALPRQNGELVFAAPWESRAFGMAVAAHEQGLFEWAEFQAQLIAEIAAHEPDDGSRYWSRWLAALERLLLERAVVTLPELEHRSAHLALEDDHAHDHEHAHAHDH
jgi:nitrile hydratase accessory protein